MNGRIYDPLLGRFLSADVVVQVASNLQSYNRYSYVFNNPLSHTDPSGFMTDDDRKRIDQEMEKLRKLGVKSLEIRFTKTEDGKTLAHVTVHMAAKKTDGETSASRLDTVNDKIGESNDKISQTPPNKEADAQPTSKDRVENTDYAVSQLSHDEYVIVNAQEADRKNVIGVFITDTKNYRGFSGRTLSMSAEQKWGKKWLLGINAINEELGSKDKAVQMAVAGGATGYSQYLVDHRDQNSEIGSFYAGFHGSGTRANGKVHIGASAGLDSEEFENYSRVLINHRITPTFDYCAPLDLDKDQKISYAMPIRNIREDLKKTGDLK